MRTRRLKITALGIAAAAAIPLLAKLTQDDRIAHALDRLTFGARPGEVERVRQIGLKKWLDQQLHPERIEQNPVLESKLAPLETLQMKSTELAAKFQKRKRKSSDLSPDELRALRDATPEERRAMLQAMPSEKRSGMRKLATASPEQRREMLSETRPLAVVAMDLNEAKIYRAVYSTRQLEEVLADFWFNHFNVFLDKGADRVLVTSYERDAIRPHVLGKFSDMLLATAQHPAMLFYLDNWQSVSPDAQTRRKRGLNENYARELMELHTLGVDGGYTQKDVTEVARCFTGWTIRSPRAGGGFHFDARVHDRGEKTVLGVKIPAGGGKEDGLKVLEMLSNHPSTARYVSRKLAQRFVADDPPQALIEKMARTFQKSHGDVRAVMKTMLDSDDFWSEKYYRAKVKSPLEMAASALRAVDADVQSAWAVAQQIAQLGQPLYRKQEPTGYSNTSEEWINSAGLLARMNFATALMANRIPGVRVDSTVKPEMRVISPETKAAIDKAEPAKVAGLLLGSPDFQRR